MLARSLFALGAIAGLAAAAPAEAAGPGTAYDNVVVFGDSLSDVGNVSLFTGGAIPGSPYFEGRWSNGLLWVEHVAGAYGVTLKPSLSQGGGNDWAYGGAETTVDVTGTLNSQSYTIPSLKSQSKAYLAAVSGKADPKALYVIWGGGNDVKASLLCSAGVTSSCNGTPTPGNLPLAYAGKTAAIVARLKAAGARSFLVVGVPDVGLTPDALALNQDVPGASTEVTALSKAMNGALAIALADPSLNAGAAIYSINTLKIMDVIILGSTGFAFTDLSTPCLTGSPATVCADPDHSFFWDGFHPTAFAHADVAIEALKALPLH